MCHSYTRHNVTLYHGGTGKGDLGRVLTKHYSRSGGTSQPKKDMPEVTTVPFSVTAEKAGQCLPSLLSAVTHGITESSRLEEISKIT